MPDPLFFFAEGMSTLTPAQRVQYLEKARAKKAHPDNKVSVLNQLEVGEGDKKKRKCDSSRISVPVRDRASSPSAAVGAAEADEVPGEMRAKSPVKKRSQTLIKKGKKDQDASVLEGEVQEVDDTVMETPLVLEENVDTVAKQADGSSPWDPLFNLELFLEKMVNLAGNSSRFNTTPTDELLRMALGHELKGLLLNYALAARQRAEVATAKEKEVLVNNKMTVLEGDVNAAKEKLEGEVKTLKKQCEEEVAKLVKEHDEELARIKKDHEAMTKTLKTVQDSLAAKDGRLKALAKDNEVALSELASLRRDNEKLVS
jgi:hypothetical protein